MHRFFFIATCCILVVSMACSSSVQRKDPVSTDHPGIQGGETAGDGMITQGGTAAETRQTVSTEEGLLFSGTFSVNVSGYMGTLTLNVENGRIIGYILFPQWGKGVAYELKDVSINIAERKIYFVRSVTTEEERTRTGSTRFFTQMYYGEFSPDWKKIKGVYREAGAENSWQAER